MLPTNVMTFMKKMVTSDETTTSSTQNSSDASGGTFDKLKQTLSSSLLTAQDRVNKITPKTTSIVGDAENACGDNQQQQISESAATLAGQNSNQSNNNTNDGSNRTASKQQNETPGRRAGACRVCLKSFKPNDFHKTCFECQQRVCEDCASYSKLEENEDANTWRCSVCRRKMASRVFMPHDSNDSLLDVPVLEALQRRHSDAKLGSTQTLAPVNGAVLAPPRSPELRRHSDVSPASLKELEKLKGCRTSGEDTEWQRGGRSVAPSRSGSPPRQEEFVFDSSVSRKTVRRASHIGRQHSYDDEPLSGMNSGGAVGSGGLTTNDLSSGLPLMPRRKSAYDVYATGILQPDALTTIQSSQRSPNCPTNAAAVLPGSRRPSFRIPHVSDDAENEESPLSETRNPALTVDDDRRIRRRGSQLPDLAVLQARGAIPSNVATSIGPTAASSFTGPNLEDLEAPRRQTSLDGEAIKIVIHDVDSGPICSSKRRIVLHRDHSDKTHRTRGFGMRVVGGKTGADGRLFAYIVWTVPGGPAEKSGLQQGDKILEWNGTSLIDRSFEEVCSIINNSCDIVELLVEHATDFRMCDLFDESLPSGNSGGSNGGTRRPGDDSVGLNLIPDPETNVDKLPASPTRRKLPKTPEQIARERQVSGRVQIQVWYHAERKELVVSLMAADGLALRNDAYDHGNLPEAYAKVRILPKCGDDSVQQTEVSTPTQNPIWNATLTFAPIEADALMDRYIEIQLWDLVPHTESVFLGECRIELQKAFLGDRAIWCRLEDPKGLRAVSISKSCNVSPRGSLVQEMCGSQIDVTHLLRRNSPTQKSIADDIDSICEKASLLHPDHAYTAGSRRASSQSETIEVELYQLNKDFSRSLPGSRRSSFQDEENRAKNGSCTTPPSSYLVGRRRSSLSRRDPDEVLKSLKIARGELGRAMSLGTETPPNFSNIRMGSRRHSRVALPSTPSSRKNSMYDITMQHNLANCVNNNTTNVLADNEDQHQQKLQWTDGGNYLPFQTPKYSALTGLGHATSATNIPQNVTFEYQQNHAALKQNYLLGSQGMDYKNNMRKGSMFNLPTTSNAPLRKSSLFPLNAYDAPSHSKFAMGRLQDEVNALIDNTATANQSISRRSSTVMDSTNTKITENIVKKTANTMGVGSPSVLRRQSVAVHQNSSSSESLHGSKKTGSPIKKASITSTATATAASTTTTITNSTYTDYGLRLGPGQIHPKGYRLLTARHGELKMGFLKVKGTVEIEIFSARNIIPVDCETPPDTYVKCYIKDGDRLRHKKKTRVVRRAVEPVFKQTIKYQSSDVFGRNIVIMLWQRCMGFEHNQSFGGTEVNLDKIEIAQHIGGWYPLFPMHSYDGFDSDNSS